MSVLKSKRKESKYEPVTYSEELHDMLLELIQHNFGVKDLEHFVRQRFYAGEADPNDFWQYYHLMHNAKKRIDQLCSELTGNTRAANTIYPTNYSEYKKRRDYQNYAIVNCQQLIKELQRTVEVFQVDINLYKRHVKAIEKEIDLVKRWRQRDNKFKKSLQGSN